MSNEIVERMRRHLGRGHTFKLEEDEFTMPPLEIGDLPEFYELSTVLYDKGIGGLNQGVVKQLINLIRKSCAKSKDIDVSDPVLLDQFIGSNFIPLMNALLSANTPETKDLPPGIAEQAANISKDGRGPTVIK